MKEQKFLAGVLVKNMTIQQPDADGAKSDSHAGIPGRLASAGTGYFSGVPS